VEVTKAPAEEATLSSKARMALKKEPLNSQDTITESPNLSSTSL